MKALPTLLLTGTIAGLSFTSLAQTTTVETTSTSTTSSGVTTESTTTTTYFTPEVQKQVVTYFDTYKTEKYGLPPAVVEQIQIEQIPSVWISEPVQPGYVVEKQYQTYLVAPPAELITVLPEAPAETSYYLMGNQVVAVDANYHVVEAFQVPSISIDIDG